MPAYIITYDTHMERDYQPLYKGMVRAQGVRLAESVWGLFSSLTAAEVRDWVREMLDRDDTIVVVQAAMSGDWATIHATKTATDWLRLNVNR